MAIIKSLVFAVLLTASTALPPVAVGNTVQKGTASLTQVHNPKFVRNGPLELERTLRKYGAPVPHDLKAAVKRVRRARNQKRAESEGADDDDDDDDENDRGSVQNSPKSYDVEYLMPVSLGTPAQQLNLDLDTGSSDFWVFSTLLKESMINGQTLYDPNASTTADKMEGYSWKITYGDQSYSSGDVYVDTVTIGDLTVSTQAVEAAREVSEEFTADSDNDGLVGLGFGIINTVMPYKQKTFFEKAMPGLDSPVFTADLKSGAPGRYNFGYIDDGAYTGNITYVPVNSSDGFWSWVSPGFQVGTTGSFNSTRIHGIADTGTTLLLLPEGVCEAFYGRIASAKYDASQGGYTFECNDSTTPDFYFGTGNGQMIRIPGSYLAYSKTDTSSLRCFGGMQSDSGVGFTIWGDIALKAAFIVFDQGSERLGWAEKSLY
uniref:Endothiapepsin n=2 Tax=Podospora anserina (strain S / ATCC MYA-4624 / DSM 980 / FGSC 10383) TaxID=515849 RepID=A0A090C889_PODAN|nr:Putative endothiapepsin precursor [Podospora anserina S mat+]